ncbi:MAG: cupin domain-containing protein [Chloroflexi bacterium]|nr:cupin domain-containing protein [Chloroflexota bacterium]
MKSEEKSGKHYVKNYQLKRGQAYGNYPESLVRNFRIKQLMGPEAQIQEEDAHLVVFEIAPGTYYPAHTHAWPEIYFILEGAAECTWGDETFIAEPGTFIYGPPHTAHAMRIIGDNPLVTIISSWAPGGRTDVFSEEGRLIEEVE